MIQNSQETKDLDLLQLDNDEIDYRILLNPLLRNKILISSNNK